MECGQGLLEKVRSSTGLYGVKRRKMTKLTERMNERSRRRKRKSISKLIFVLLDDGKRHDSFQYFLGEAKVLLF